MSLREAHVELIDCDHRTPPPAPTGHPYIAIPQLRDGRIDMSEARRITPEDYRDWTRRAKPRPNDVVLSRRTNPGVTAFVPEGLEFAVGQNLVLLRSDGTVVRPAFLRWLVRGPDWWEQIQRHLNVGAVFDSLKCADIPNFRLPIPPLDQQERIASLLGAVDDKIELDGRMSQTLESMARALFKSWFVDFDPVRANSEVRDLGLPARLADLFSDSLHDSELGEIPSGWPTIPFIETVDVIGGGTPKTAVAEYWDGDIPWFSVADAPNDSAAWVVDTEKKITRAGLENSSTRILPTGTTIVTARGTVGRVALVGIPMAMNQSCYGLQNKSSRREYFTYFSTRYLVSTLQQHAHGSVFDTITRDTLAGVSVIVPPPEVVEAFEVAVTPIMQKARAGVLESRLLATARDALLVHLLPGPAQMTSSVPFSHWGVA
jgi:type I restriction enzyme S subunit